METVKVGVVGLGNMGSVHAKCINNNEVKGLKLTAVCDIDKSVLEKFETYFSDVQVFTDYKQMILSGKIDAVIIATPHYFHPEIAEFAFLNGLNVLTEKPSGVLAEDVKRMNEASERSGKVFAIMFNQRTNSLFRTLKEMVENNELGNIKRVTWNITNWYRTQDYYDSGSWRGTWAGEGGGVLINQAPHNLDIIQWVFGVPQKVFANLSVGKYHNIEVEDEAEIIMKYDDGKTIIFITSTGETPGTNRLEVSGTKGKAVLENGKISAWKSELSEREYCFNSEYHSSHIKYDYSEISDTKDESAHKGILQNFANAILYGEPLIADGKDGINELLISNAAYLSSWFDKWVELNNFPFDDFREKLNELREKSHKKIYKKRVSQSDEYKNRWQVRW